MNKVILYIATSQDGFIADINGGVDWLPQPKDENELDLFGYTKLINDIDIILMGSKSYEQILGFGDWGWKDKQTYVFTSRNLNTKEQYVTTTRDTPLEFMQKYKNSESKKDIWLLGGAKLAKSFSDHNLIDEIILTIIPKTLGDGISLGLNLEDFKLIKDEAISDNIIQKTYIKLR
jgi:dihydrofolate reductase